MKTTIRMAMVVLAGLALQACAGGGGSAAEAMTTVGASPAPAAVDSFTQNVQAVAAVPSDLGSPVALDSYVAVAADQAAPVKVY